MKNFKKITSAIAALSLAACVAVPMSATVFTASAAYTVTITDSTDEDGTHIYEAYQIFKGTLDEKSKVLSDIDWGKGVSFTGEKTVESLYDALDTAGIKVITKKETFAAAYESWVATNEGKSERDYIESGEAEDYVTKTKPASPKDVADALSGLERDAAKAQKFADIIAGYLSTTVAATSTSSKIDATLNIEEAGYYLIQDQSGSPTSTPDTGSKNSGAKTRYILQVVGNETVNAKASAPEVMKKVQEGDLTTAGGDADKETASFAGNASYEVGDGYNDVADYDIGDDVPFKLYGSMPETLGDYEHYYYKFTDTLGPEFVAPEKDNITVYIDGAKVTSGVTVKVDEAEGTGIITITVEFMDILNCTPKPTATSVVTVEYSANLDSDAEIGLPGQENKVDLTYSNNPNSEWDGTSAPGEDTGKTPEDKVIVFTYELDVTKYLDEKPKTADNKAGTQAGFKLYSSDETKVATFADGVFKGWVSAGSETADDELKTDANGKFYIKGVEDGTYTLKETTVPAGYNKMDDLTVVVEATTVNSQTWSGTDSEALTALKLYHKSGESKSEVENACTDLNSGIVNDTIVNQKGAELPSTGGIGTTLFYLGGGALVAVAGVMLITKKRMTKE